jgi:hypothetical protein
MDIKYSGWMCYKNSTRWVWDETKWMREANVKRNEEKIGGMIDFKFSWW